MVDQALVPFCDLRRGFAHDCRRPLEPPRHLTVFRPKVEDPVSTLLQRRQLTGDVLELLHIVHKVLLTARFLYELVELLGEVFDGPVDVPETHDLAGVGGQLLGQLVADLVEKFILLAHEAVDCGEDGLLERLFVQGGGVFADPFPVVQAVDATPDGAFQLLLRPDDAAVGGTALAADQEAGQGVLAAVLPKPGRRTLFRAGGHGPPAGSLRLDGVEHLPADDALVVVLDQDLGELPGVLDDLFADAVLDEGLLQEHVAAVFLILQDGLQPGDIPGRLAGDVGHTVRLQPGLEGAEGISGQVAVIDKADSFRLVRHDLRLAVFTLHIAQEPLVLDDGPACFHCLMFSPAHVFADALAFGLGEGSVEGDEEFALRVDGVDVLLLEDHGDAQVPQFAGVLDDVQGVSGEAGEGFGQDEVDPAHPALSDHLLELLPALDGGAGDALVRKHRGHGPLGILRDLLGIIGSLGLVTGELLLVVGRHAAVGGDPEVLLGGLGLDVLLLGGNDDDLGSRIRHFMGPPLRR